MPTNNFTKSSTNKINLQSLEDGYCESWINFKKYTWNSLWKLLVVIHSFQKSESVGDWRNNVLISSTNIWNQNVWNIGVLYFTAGPFLPGHLFVHLLIPASLLEGPHLYLAVAIISFFVCCLCLLFVVVFCLFCCCLLFVFVFTFVVCHWT